MYIPKILGLGAVLAITAWTQDKPQLRARELFYTPIADTAPAAKAKPTPPAKTAAVKTARPSKPKPGRTSDPVPNTADETSEAHLQNVSHTTDVGPPLALKYRLLKRAEDGRYNEVDSDTVFRSGDKIRVSVEANDGAYLYIVQQGSSKAWNVLFPNEDTEHGNNHIQRNREYELPGGGRFTFDEQPGTERLFLVLSRRPEPDLEKLIYSLHGGTGKPASTPGATEPKAETRMMIAQSRIDDAIVNRLRTQFLSRDLVFEKVDDETPQRSGGARRETALYVATTDRTANARVVVDLTLKHQ